MENIKGKVLDVTGAKDVEGGNVQVHGQHKGANQRWNIVYVDEVKPDPKKGDFITDYGLYHLRDFYIISAMPSRRYLDRLGSKVVIKVPNNRASQVWRFDHRTRGITAKENPAYALHMQNNGKGQAIEMARAAAQWW
jgi:hypothetical protein